MRVRPTHAVPSRQGTAAARALAVLLASGCGSPVSLDASAPTSTEASTTAALPSTSSGEPGSSGSAAPPPDVPIPDVPGLPPGACPAECAVELPLVWAWDEDPPHGATERRLVGMARAPNGTLVVAETRGDQSWLTGLDRDGVHLWTQRMTFGCVCQITDVAFDVGGELLVMVESGPSTVRPVMVYGYFMGADGPIENWSFWDVVRGTPERSGRTGMMSALGFDEIMLSVVEVGLVENRPDKEWIALRSYTQRGSQWLVIVDTQIGFDPRWQPRSAVLQSGQTAVTLPGVGSEGDYVVWVEVGFVTDSQRTPGPIDAMAASPDGSIVVAGTRLQSPGQLELHVAAVEPTGPLPWQLAVGVPSTTTRAPMVAVDALGAATVALRTTSGPPDAPDQTAVALWRIAADGTLLWSTSLPLPAAGSPSPVELVLADDEQDLVLAALVDGRLHVEHREQGCACD